MCLTTICHHFDTHWYLQSWVQMMANYTKQVDPNHMVTVGYEGFWGQYDSDVQYNPGNGWAGISGQNFSRNMAHAEIDFTEIHFWPDTWFATGTQEQINFDQQQFLNSWIDQHARVSAELGKPLFLEEFGKAVKVRSNPRSSIWCCSACWFSRCAMALNASAQVEQSN